MALAGKRSSELCVFVEGSLITAYVEGVALTARVYGYAGGVCGLFVECGSAAFRSVELAVPRAI